MKKNITQKKLIILLSLFIFTISFIAIGQGAEAAPKSIFQKANKGFSTMMGKAYGGTIVGPNTFSENLIIIINYILTFLGTIFLLTLIYTGYLWMTARGNEEQISKAKKIAREALIGLLIVFFSRLITEFILTQFNTALNPVEG